MITAPLTRDSAQLTLHQWLKNRSLLSVMQETEHHIKQNPTDPKQRWLLFQLLCLQGDWLRGLKQLQWCAQMQPEFEQEAQAYRGLMGCELYRQECYAGKKQPAFIRPQPTWVDQLLQAIAFNHQGEEDRADDMREIALNAADSTSGVSTPGGEFAWISDSDTWLGPAIELVIGGVYTWVPFNQIRKMTSKPPRTTLDLLWKPASLHMADGSEHHVFLMTRCCGSESAGDPFKLCRETSWSEHGRTSVRALGQKTWQTDQGDIGVLEVTECTFNTSADQKAVIHG